jgi:hypothetical protein
MQQAKRVRRAAVLCVLLSLCGLAARALAQDANSPIDWRRAQRLLQRERAGQALTAEEQAYLDRAKAERQRMQGSQPQAGGVAPSTRPTGLVPLDQMTAQDRYKGQDGGLYGGGSNTAPEGHRKAAETQLAQVVPRDGQGKPADGGKVVLLSMGMSNTTQEFSRFQQLAGADADKAPCVAVVDGAQGGQDAERWSQANLPPWQVAMDRLRAAGATPQQVQALWVKHARIQPARFGEFPRHAEELRGHFLASLQLARERFPNLRVAYLSSRIYAGYASTPLNPEPYAYESGLVVRGLILDQIKGEPALNCDPAKGPVKAPLLLWGPYLWTDGPTPRKSDGLSWAPQDVGPDGTHPSLSGRNKVATLLLNFFKTDPLAKGWYLGAPPPARSAR